MVISFFDIQVQTIQSIGVFVIDLIAEALYDDDAYLIFFNPVMLSWLIAHQWVVCLTHIFHDDGKSLRLVDNTHVEETLFLFFFSHTIQVKHNLLQNMPNLHHTSLPNVENTDVEKKVTKLAVHIVEIVVNTHGIGVKIADSGYEVYPMNSDFMP